MAHDIHHKVPPPGLASGESHEHLIKLHFAIVKFYEMHPGNILKARWESIEVVETRYLFLR